MRRSFRENPLLSQQPIHPRPPPRGGELIDFADALVKHPTLFMKTYTLMCRVLALMSALGAMTARGADKIDFATEIKPLLESACLSCHGTEKPKGDLQLTTRAMALKGGEKGTSLVPGKSAASPLYKATVLPPGHDDIMPPKGAPLTQWQADTLKRWIDEGADWPESITLTKVQRFDFVKDVKPILEFECVACHREGHDQGGLRLDTREMAFKGGDSGPGIVAFRPQKSPVSTSTMASREDDKLMPPAKKGGPMSKEKITTLAKWIEQGASWPEGLTLVPKKREEMVGDEKVIVAAIQAKIVKQPPAKNQAEMKGYTNFIPGTTVKYSMVPIPGGEFLMGSPATEKGRRADEGPQHKVKIPPFWMGQFEVTWNEYELFMYPDQEKALTVETNSPYLDKVSDAVTRPTKPYVEMSFGMGKGDYPAISMTHHAASKYCEWLSAKTGHFYRLPTEAEWEYAARAGTTTAYFFGDDPARLKEFAWTAHNSDFKYQKVGRKKANPWGLFDIYGNVMEWCLDQYDPAFYANSAGSSIVDPWNKSTTPYPHVARGGHWDDEDLALFRSASRRFSTPQWKQQDPQLPKSIWYHTDAQWLGIRLVRPLEVPSPEEMQKLWNNGVERE
jgi:formylglycine-generating enzyme required for sulfatase activity